MTPPLEAPSRFGDVEGLAQLGLTLAVGLVAAAASWSHVLDLATRHGQGGWLAWAVAACIETSAISAGLEVRRCRRRGHRYGLPLLVLVGATALQLAAQVAQAERSGWGVVLAAVPAVTFLILVKLTLGRTSPPSPDIGTNWTASPVLVEAHVDASLPPGETLKRPEAAPPALEPAHRALPSNRDASNGQDVDVADLLLVGRAVADDLTRQGLPLNRRSLLAGIRARGRSCSTERASALIKALRKAAPSPADDLPLPDELDAPAI